MMMLNKVFTRGLKRLGSGRFLSISRYRQRKGLPPAPSASGPLCDEPDWSYPDGTPGQMTKGQSQRYQRDQEFGKTIVREFAKLKTMKQMGGGQKLEAKSVDGQ